ncbi:signal peptidase II [Xanthobacter sp. TB0139]|uniref:signal peptidase II n=1 Tax=Xanthobacter sp. TB0139 TaxID=3459178 RepID=UPI00403A659D
MRIIALGLVTAIVVLILDQATKVWALTALQNTPAGAIRLSPFLDIVAVWNYGISYGLFQQGETGRWILVGIKIVAVLAFAIWLTRTRRRADALALGLLIGGALGNAIDRVMYGAVFDFISLHAFGYHWYVFNVADIAVVVGVIVLLVDAFFGNASKSPPSDTGIKATSEGQPSDVRPSETEPTHDRAKP